MVHYKDILIQNIFSLTIIKDVLYNILTILVFWQIINNCSVIQFLKTWKFNLDQDVKGAVDLVTYAECFCIFYRFLDFSTSHQKEKKEKLNEVIKNIWKL